MASSSSSKPFESKDPIELLPPELVGPHALTHIPTGIPEIMFECVDGADADETGIPIWLTTPATAYTFYGIPSLKKQILSCAEYAGPLEQIEAYVRQDHNRSKRSELKPEAKKKIEEQTKTTLKEAIKRAIIGLDQAIPSDGVHKGMAERLFELYDELYCRHLDPSARERELETVRAEAQLAAPLESKEEEKNREDMNFAAVNEVFNAIKRNDGNTQHAIENFKTFVKSTKPKGIATRQHHLNLLHLAFATSDVLNLRGGELRKIEEKDPGQWRGTLADQFCFKIIGDAIEKEFPPRMQQLVRGALTEILNGTRHVVRDLDVTGIRFCGKTGSAFELGVNFYYDDNGRWWWGAGAGDRQMPPGNFRDLYEQLRQPPKFITPRLPTDTASAHHNSTPPPRPYTHKPSSGWCGCRRRR